MEDEVFEMDEFAVDPQRGAGVSEMGSFDPALSDRRTGDALVQTRQGDASVAFTSHSKSEIVIQELGLGVKWASIFR